MYKINMSNNEWTTKQVGVYFVLFIKYLVLIEVFILGLMIKIKK
jgi:hypothetical protein